MKRLAEVERTTPEKMCKRLARQVGYRVATVDSILWRACAEGILSSSRYVVDGWRRAFSGRPNHRFLIEYEALERELTPTDTKPGQRVIPGQE